MAPGARPRCAATESWRQTQLMQVTPAVDDADLAHVRRAWAPRNGAPGGARRGIRDPHANSGAGDSARHERARRHGSGADWNGQDGSVHAADRRSADRWTAAHPRPRSDADARAVRAGRRERAASTRGTPSSSVLSVYGGVPLDPQEKKLRAGVDIVVATPGRLIDHLERQNVVFDDLEVLVLDEADRMLDMGFAPQINRIVADVPNYRQTLLFSATMPPEVEALARKYLRKPVVVQVGRRSSAASTVTHAVYPVPRDRKSALLAAAAQGRRHSTRCSCSRARSTAPTASCAISSRRTSRRRRCTPTRPSRSARARSRISRAARCACSSRPTSRSAGSTSRASPTS